MNAKKAASVWGYDFQIFSRMANLVFKRATVLVSKVAVLVRKRHWFVKNQVSIQSVPCKVDTIKQWSFFI